MLRYTDFRFFEKQFFKTPKRELLVDVLISVRKRMYLMILNGHI